MNIPECIFPAIAIICGWYIGNRTWAVLAEYWVAQRTKNYLAVSIILTGIWLIIWMSGFN
jgi:hypothetical protein